MKKPMTKNIRINQTKSRARIITVELDKPALKATEEIFSNIIVIVAALTKHTLADMKLHHTLA